MGEKIDGRKISKEIKEEIKAQIAELKEKYGRVPGIAVILVGDRKDSQTYVRSKERAAEYVGMKSFKKVLPATATQEEIESAVDEFNNNPEVDGILVQLPLPDGIDENKVLDRISIEKDVDGFNPYNIGLLAMKGRTPLSVSCTPKGIIELLKREKVEISGKNAVVVGRSNIVGMPVALLLLHENATVTIVHSRTKDIESVVRSADIVVVAIGRAEFVKGSWIKKGAVVIDVGINSVDDPTRKRGYRLVGDVEYDEAVKNASKITPVPGGVGPMTIAMLMSNCLNLYLNRVKKE